MIRPDPVNTETPRLQITVKHVKAVELLIHPCIFLTAYPMRVVAEMKPLLADTEQEAEYNVDRSQGLPQKDRQPHTNNFGQFRSNSLPKTQRKPTQAQEEHGNSCRFQSSRSW